MSETAQTLIKGALRSIGAIATGETPTAAELNDGLEVMQMMFQNWSAHNIRIYSLTMQAATFDGSSSYTFGSGGDINATRPVAIIGAQTATYPLKIIDFEQYQRVSVSGSGGLLEYIWYNPAYPLGYVYPWALTSESVTLDCLNALTDPTAITSSIAFPPEYNDAIKWNLAVRLAPEYGKEASETVQNLAFSTLTALENRNFAHQMNAVRPELVKLASARYNIDRD